MKPVHQILAILGTLAIIGSLPGGLGDSACGSTKTCEGVSSCVAKHGGGENIKSLLFPCGAHNSKKVCCPAPEDGAKTIMGRIRSLQEFDLGLCGVDTSERIKNGHEAESGQFPWMALLGYSERRQNKINFYCAGSLITKQYVLTAAHCLTIPNQILKVVRLGELDQRMDPDCIPAEITGSEKVCHPPVVTINVARYYSHKGYNLQQLKNDIALVRLVKPITVSGTIRPICIPFNLTALGADEKLQVAGWGKIDHDTDEGSPVLMWTFVNTTSTEDCNALVNSQTRVITSKQICASGHSGEDACKGDSGGPLMYLNPETSSVIQVGIVSYGLRKCGMPNSPTVYTRLSEYTDWVLDTMQILRGK